MKRAGLISRLACAGIALAALLAVAPPGGAGQEPARRDIFDSQHAEIGGFERWRKRRARDRTVPEPRGWVSQLNGWWGARVLKKVRGRTGFAVKGTVIKSGHGPLLAPTLSAGDYDPQATQTAAGRGLSEFVDRPAAVTGYYQFQPRGGDRLYVAVDIRTGGESVGRGAFETNDATIGWTEFTVPIDYDPDAQVGRLHIMAFIFGPQQGDQIFPVHKGSFYLLDDLAYVDPVQ